MISKVSVANTPSKVGLQTNKISFGKGYCDESKDYSSSSYSMRSEPVERPSYVKSSRPEPVEPKRHVNPAEPDNTIRKEALIQKLKLYAHDPIIVKIIADQLASMD